MGYDQPERSNSSGAIVAVLVVVLLVAVLVGLLVVGVGAFFWVGTARVQRQAVVAEMDARMQAERAQAMAEQARVAMEAQRRRAETLGQRNLATDPVPASPARREFELSISQDGTVSVEGQSIDLDELRSRLEKLKAESGTVAHVRIDVAAECPHEHLISVLDACHGVASEVTFRMSPSEPAEPMTEGQEAAKD